MAHGWPTVCENSADGAISSDAPPFAGLGRSRPATPSIGFVNARIEIASPGDYLSRPAM